ncbi:hypothetical protein ACSQ67_021523 [Phaseolus vulgaris]
MSSFSNTVSEARRSGKAPEKSSFSQTCSLLSQFLKEKRASGDSTLGMVGKMEPKASTKDLFGSLQNSDGALKLSASAMDFLPQLVENPCIKKSNLRGHGVGHQAGVGHFRRRRNSPSGPVTTKELAEAKVPQTNTSETPKLGSQGVGSDMRYPRRASLLKFLEKRKERVIARGPYQMNNQKAEGSSSGGEPEDQCSKQFDLNL